MKTFKEFQEACWTGYAARGMKKKGNRMVPNCVPVKEDGEGAAAGAPANNVGAGNIAGTGGKAGEPGINLSGFGRKKKSPVMMPIRTRTPPKM
jgi:hypothetical protein